MREKVLIVDDAELNREILEEILIDEYSVIQAEGGEKALELLEAYHDDIAVVLLDLLMPGVDGYTVLTFMKEKSWIGRIPVLVISTETSSAAEERCFELGVSDFIRKPFANSQVKQRVKNIVDLFSYKNELEKEVKRQTQTVQRQYKLLQNQTEKLQKVNISIIDILGSIVEYRNLENGLHIWHVKEFTKILAKEVAKEYPEYGLSQKKITMITDTSALHDIGKIAIPDSILLKPGKLTDEEFEYMKSHTLRGCEIIKNIENIWDENYRKTCYEICRGHHERYDGKGYPDGLAGEEIPISAQIVSVADVYDALISERVYKNSYSKDEAYHMIITGECGVFSPKLLECFRNVREEFEKTASERTDA